MLSPLSCSVKDGPLVIAAISCLPTLDSLRSYVLQVLCQHDQLDPGQTPMHQAVLMRSGRPCGLFFQVQGPRMVKTYAIWAGEENRILFYDSMGGRFAETRLTEAPDPLKLATNSAAKQRSRKPSSERAA